MTKQPDSSGSIFPRHGSADAQESPVVPRLPTVAPLGKKKPGSSPSRTSKTQPVDSSSVDSSPGKRDSKLGSQPAAKQASAKPKSNHSQKTSKKSSQGVKAKRKVASKDSIKDLGKRVSKDPSKKDKIKKDRAKKDARFKAPPKLDQPEVLAPVGTAPKKKITSFPRITRRRTFEELLEDERAAAKSLARKKNNPFYGLGGVRTPIDPNAFHEALSDYEPHSNEEDSEDGKKAATVITTNLRRHRHPLSSALFSMVVHLAIFLTLAFFVLNWPEPKPRISVLASIDANPVPEKPVNMETETVKIEIPDDSQSLTDATATDTSVNETMKVADNSQVIPNVAINDIAPTPNERITVPSAPIRTLPTGGGLEGRQNEARAKLAAAQGGSLASEAAVENGLRWIVAHQKKNGSWRFRHNCEACKGQCANSGSSEDFTNAATGLALMSLMGAGYTHEVGPYQQEIRKGLDYLKKKMRYSQLNGNSVGSLADRGGKGMYGHALATIALGEAYALTADSGLARPVEAARNYIEFAQNKSGGWRYIRLEPRGDLTVSGWQIMALKSCQLAGVETDKATWMRSEAFVDSLISSDGKYGYQKSAAKVTDTTTAIGVLSKMYLGTHYEDLDLIMGADFISDTGPSDSDIYFNYYATQILHHRGGEPWQAWNKGTGAKKGKRIRNIRELGMRDFLIQTQDQSNSHQAGSWYFADKAGHSKTGGRLYTTAMSVMILEVYYRYLPLYEKKAMESVTGDE